MPELTFEQIKIILSWADFCVETGEGFEPNESELYDQLNSRADELAKEATNATR